MTLADLFLIRLSIYKSTNSSDFKTLFYFSKNVPYQMFKWVLNTHLTTGEFDFRMGKLRSMNKSKLLVGARNFGCFEKYFRLKPAGIYLFKVNNRNPSSGISIVDFEQVNADWEASTLTKKTQF